jgi:hypothetical protein
MTREGVSGFKRKKIKALDQQMPEAFLGLEQGPITDQAVREVGPVC